VLILPHTQPLGNKKKSLTVNPRAFYGHNKHEIPKKIRKQSESLYENKQKFKKMLKNKEKLPLLCWRFPPIKKNISPLFFQKKLYFFSIWEGNFRIRGASRLPFYALTMHHSPALGRGLVRPLAGARYTPPWAGRLALAPLPRRWRLVRLPARWGSLIARLGRRPCAAPLSRPAGLVRCGVFWRAPAFFLFNAFRRAYFSVYFVDNSPISGRLDSERVKNKESNALIHKLSTSYPQVIHRQKLSLFSTIKQLFIIKIMRQNALYYYVYLNSLLISLSLS
jgi:hypothetical protein